MYDPFAYVIIEDLPDLEGLSSDMTRRALSRAYFAFVNLRLKETWDISESTRESILFMRRLANTLESRAVFDAQVEPDERRGCAFVAAEALSLLANLRERLLTSSASAARIEREDIFSRVESALLYIIAGYDANAGGVVRDIRAGAAQPHGSEYRQAEMKASEWALDMIIRLCTFHLKPLPRAMPPEGFVGDPPGSLTDLEHDVRGRLYAKLGGAVKEYIAWLTGQVPDGLATAHEQLTQIAHRLAQAKLATTADVHHLARLLLVALENTEARALLHVVPPPDAADKGQYLAYLRTRAMGPEGGSGRPLLWPSVHRYVERCLPGPNRHAVVSMPTGSGKSFLAELAASQAIHNGWALYLVPTNALAHQVRRDLRSDLKSLNAEVRAFIGAGEYTTLDGERVQQVPTGTVAVMTPEKCSLSMRLNPQAFEECTLCIFDECHLIGEKARGVIAELVLSQLMALAPDCRFLLMSAIVENPDTLGAWLGEASTSESAPVRLDWRPTRSLRCAVGVDIEAKEAEEPVARQRLESKSPFFKNEKFEANLALLAGLQGAWQTHESLDYAFAKLPARALLQVHRERSDGGWTSRLEAPSWVNQTSGRLGVMLAEAGLPTLLFLPASKHYPFTVGGSITLSDRVQAELAQPSERVRAFVTLARDELGVSSEVGTLIERGLSVHTAALLETEKFASEEAFRDGTTRIMLATGTLSQGLNLPAIAVVIGGTRIGYSPGEEPAVVQQRQLSQLLNASGRAGRAGFANQGLVIAVPDSGLLLGGPEAATALSQHIPFLAEADASVEILSPLQSFIDSIAIGQFDAELASREELVAAAMLVGGSPQSPQPAEVLRRTYAAYLRRRSDLDDGAEVGAFRLAEVRTEFVAASGGPEWLPVAAQRAGLGFFSTLRLLQAWARVMPQLPADAFEWDTQAWVKRFFEALQYLTPKQVGDVFDAQHIEMLMPRSVPEMRAVVRETLRQAWDDPEWVPPEQWRLAWRWLERVVKVWMDGKPMREVASQLLALDLDSISSQRNRGDAPIPKSLAFVNRIADRLAMLGGGIVAIVEQELAASAGEDPCPECPFELSTMPLCLKYGCDNPQTLAWYRFGLRFRRPAHLLTRAFPLDPTIRDDGRLLEAVRLLRRSWARGETLVPQPLRDMHGPLFDAIKTILATQDEPA